jgi:hypothetical protein
MGNDMHAIPVRTKVPIFARGRLQGKFRDAAAQSFVDRLFRQQPMLRIKPEAIQSNEMDSFPPVSTSTRLKL